MLCLILPHNLEKLRPSKKIHKKNSYSENISFFTILSAKPIVKLRMSNVGIAIQSDIVPILFQIYVFFLQTLHHHKLNFSIKLTLQYWHGRTRQDGFFRGLSSYAFVTLLFLTLFRKGG